MATASSSNEETLKDSQHTMDVEEEPRDPAVETSAIMPPQDVLCDSCMDSPGKALKSCMTCLVSYCEAHLRPHLENAKFQNHRLVDPLQDVDRQTCEVHRRPLERFCLTDRCCLCLECEDREHEGHPTASVGEARTQIETELQKNQEAINQTASATEKEIGKLQSDNDFIKQFARLQTTLEEARRGLVDGLEAEQRKSLRRAESIQAHLERRKTGLMKTLARMNKLSRSKSDVDFLQEYSEWKIGSEDVSLPSPNIDHMDHLLSYLQVVTDSTQELCDLILSSNKLTICKSGTKSWMPECEPSLLPDPETPEDFLKYARSLTFDPDTVHRFLRVTEDNRKLTNTSPWQHAYPEHPSRFEYWRQAMTSDSIYLGRHYVEAELSGEGAHVGVTYKSIDPKGEQSTSCITGNDFSWCVGRNSRGFFAWHAGVEEALDATDVTRLGLYVDFHRGSVSFYDAAGPMRRLHNYTADFIEPLHITAWLSKKDNAVHLVNDKLCNETNHLPSLPVC
uniref:tripartite motif-containing protein 16-like isoform X2 n=1 Tax=Gasterosteus aculeatus aculeatus TaxID=481459 RepID=UPI001A991385|nr:tripartite motif-containing protein 16-like isoform X2 [Gasterosteus aculeatus aculeatus]